MLSRIVIISLVLSFQSLALAGELPSNNIEIISFDAGTTPAPVLIASPTIKSSSEAVKVVDIGHSSNLTTVIPVINVALPPSTKLPTVHHESVVVLPANNSIVEPTHRFGEYMKPICDALEKLSPKQIFRVQSQMKQFVQLVSSLCLIYAATLLSLCSTKTADVLYLPRMEDGWKTGRMFSGTLHDRSSFAACGKA